MVLKLKFYDRSKNNEAWWNRLWDRYNQNGDKQWKVMGGCPYNSSEVTFTFTYANGKGIKDQASIDQVVWIFVLEQINVDTFYVNGKDATSIFRNR